ncbi:hypothetical protein [Halomonas sp. E19]|uniref:hypothetical protein n=1 Tax=Halomonas sp. E19 TaxID=3397247 RepID=UPI00403410B9
MNQISCCLPRGGQGSASPCAMLHAARRGRHCSVNAWRRRSRRLASSVSTSTCSMTARVNAASAMAL